MRLSTSFTAGRTNLAVVTAFLGLAGSTTMSLNTVAQNNLPNPEAKPAPGLPSPYTIAERGPHHRVWSRVTWQTNEFGQLLSVTNAFTELETGMHYQREGQWLGSKAQIDLLADGAAATNGPHKVIFAANLNTPGAIDLTTPDGVRLRSRVFGLSYFDRSNGKAVLLGSIKDSIGLLVSDNQVIYTDAFTGVEADVKCEYSKAGFEQNTLIRSRLPSLSDFSLNPASTSLQVLTEFFDPPAPIHSERVRANGTPDDSITFGAMTMGPGSAFSVGEPNENSDRR